MCHHSKPTWRISRACLRVRRRRLSRLRHLASAALEELRRALWASLAVQIFVASAWVVMHACAANTFASLHVMSDMDTTVAKG